MDRNENERPVSSGIDEVFKAGAIKADAPKNSANAADSAPAGEHSEAQRSGGNSRRDRRNRRGRHRGCGSNDNRSIPEDTESIDDLAASDKVSEPDEEDFEGSVETLGAGGFDDSGKIIYDDPDISGTRSYTELVLTTEAPETVEVAGVRFRDTGKTYYFAPKHLKLKKGDQVIVETTRGLEFGVINTANTFVPVSAIVPPLRPVVRIATDEDRSKFETNLQKEKESFAICLEKIREHKLEMKLIDAEYTFDQSKLTFYFSADGRVDFRDLVKDLAGVFRTRIELRQIGIRDEAKLVGGLGVCGQPFCCSTFLSDFAQVSIKMAKEQNLSLNSAKISGSCGRLMCCLRFENDTYAEEKKLTPPVGSRVNTADGAGVVVESAPLRGKIKVRFGDEANAKVTEYDRGDVTVISKGAPEKKKEEPSEETEEQ